MDSFLFVGVGGSGGKTLRALKRNLIDILEHNGNYDVATDGFPSIWQFLNIDTPFDQKAEGFAADLLASNEYLGLAEKGVQYRALIESIKARMSAGADFTEEVLAPLPGPGMVLKSIDEGAGQYRAVGRSVAMARLTQMKASIERSYASLRGADTAADLAKVLRALGQNQQGLSKTRVILISSVAGGSGAGQFIDVAEAIKAAQPPGDNSGDEQIAILFAPDVFEDPKIGKRDGIAPNSLAAISELVNGKWSSGLSEVSEKLYGVNSFRSASSESNLGPKYPFIVGRTNDRVSFSSQNEVYEATAMSLAKLVTDPALIADLTLFALNNDQNKPDPFGVKLSNWKPLPLNALGFGRVSLGLDAFAKYSKQRLARYTVESMLKNHASVDAGTEDAKLNESALTMKKAVAYLPAFRAQLAVEPEQVKDQIAPQADLDTLMSDFNSEVSNRLGVDKQSADQWANSLTNAINAVYPQYRERWSRSRKETAWAKATQERILQIVAATSVSQGIKVTCLMLDRAAEGIKKISNDYAAKNSSGASDLDSSKIAMAIKKFLNEHLGIKGEFDRGAASPALSSDAVGARNAFTSDALRRSHQLLADMAENFLKPLSVSLNQAFETLSAQYSDDDFRGTGMNLVSSWPKDDLKPTTFEPAENVRVLIKPEVFASRFAERITDTFTNAEKGQTPTFQEALRQAAVQIAQGSAAIAEQRQLWNSRTNQEVPPPGTWTSFKIDRNWVPNGVMGESASKWSGTFQQDILNWLEYSSKFTHIVGRPLGKDIATSLYDWLTDKNVGEAERNVRENRMLAEFKATLEISRPFAQVDTTLYGLAHVDVSPGVSPQLSQIPVDVDSTLGRLMLDVLISPSQGWPKETAETKFVGDRGGNEIDVFATFKDNVNFFELTNFTRPVLGEWKKMRNTADGRESFMLDRRSRNLPETIPLAPQIVDSIIRGWFVAKLLGRLNEEIVNEDQGLKLEVWQADASIAGFEPLPFPLYFSGASVPTNEYLPVVLNSVRLALIECSDVRSRKPFEPYLSLIRLGGKVNFASISESDGSRPKLSSLPAAVARWIREGAVDALAPNPNPMRAGSAEMTPVERAQKVEQYFDSELRNFNQAHVNLPAGTPHNTLGFEIRREVNAALHELISLIDASVIESPGI